MDLWLNVHTAGAHVLACDMHVSKNASTPPPPASALRLPAPDLHLLFPSFQEQAEEWRAAFDDVIRRQKARKPRQESRPL